MHYERKVVMGAATLIATPIVTLVADAYLRRFLSDNPELSRKKNDVKNRHLTIFLPGTLIVGDTGVVEILDFLKSKGDVIVVNYDLKSFNTDTITKRVTTAFTEEIWRDSKLENHYDKVTLLCPSRAGGLGYHIQVEAKNRGLEQEVRTIYMDGLPGIPFLKDPRARIPGWPIFSFGPIWNLFSKPLLKAFYIMPEWGNLGEGHHREVIERDLEASFNYKLSAMHDQVRRFPVPKKDEALGLKTVYMISGRDIAIKQPDAIEILQDAYGGTVYVISLPGVTHMCGLLEYPLQCLQALQEAYDHLDRT
jgi:hypothetical protein